MQVLDGGSKKVPCPHSTALATAGETTVMNASGADAAAQTIAQR